MQLVSFGGGQLIARRCFAAALRRSSSRRFASNRKSAHYAIPPETVTIDGTTLHPDELWNIPKSVLGLLERRLLFQEGNPMNLLKRRIVDNLHTQYRKPASGSPLFTVVENMPRVVSVWDNFDSLLTPPDHISRRPSNTYYVNSNYVLRAHTSAHQHALIRQGFDNFVCVGDVYRRDEID
uniref:Phenylalanyl-tRNA synthetase domain-containing protein n=1 Tax=Plectus sambesii TaxID=2011161 RepID=A0A914WRB2_9BILA